MYPHFQPICLDVRLELQEYVQRFPPYSDFNVWNMMGWASQERRSYSFLNDNLVIRSWDCYDNRYAYSVLGASRIDDTLRELCHNITWLELIPEIVVRSISDRRHFTIEEDPDNHDYILSMEKLINLSGNSLYSIRVEVSRFAKYYPDHRIKFLDFNNIQDRSDIIKTTKLWCAMKGLSESGTQSEVDGIGSFMQYAGFFRYVSLGLYLGKKMIGFTINEVVNDNIAITHFGISDLTYEGSSRYLAHTTAKILNQLGCIYLNYEQDMGIPGLKRAKLAYRPVSFLKKYKIRIID